MSQPSVVAYFTQRKRPTHDDGAALKNKNLIDLTEATIENEPVKSQEPPVLRTRSGRQVKRYGSPMPVESAEHSPRKQGRKPGQRRVRQPKIVQYIKTGEASTLTSLEAAGSSTQAVNECTPANKDCSRAPSGSTHSARKNLLSAFMSEKSEVNSQLDLKTPTKQPPKSNGRDINTLKTLVRKELNFDEVKAKVTRSEKLNELKASLARIAQLEKERKLQEERNRRLREAGPSPSKRAAVQLKEFDTIEFEVEVSPAKLKTPIKLPPATPEKNELMSPRHTVTPKRLVFSPSKIGSPVKMRVPPAYQRFLSLAETSKAGQLPLPYKYRHLLEIFEAVDTVSAMFYNRKEVITFKKLKPGVQRLVRKNFSEFHLAQIKHIFPEGYNFHVMKTRNYGSVSKADYYQLIIKPNVKERSARAPPANTDGADSGDIFVQAQSTDLNPTALNERKRLFHSRLLERVKREHDKFLKSLDPPLIIPTDKVTRWHADFDLEQCPEVELSALPQPPNVERHSSASTILSTARNLFNCATPMERIMERYEHQVETERRNSVSREATEVSPSVSTMTDTRDSSPAPTVTSQLLKDLPQSLLERIRAKQAAKALDAMTRRPSQDQEATVYSRLPELSRYLRNVFITERKGTLKLELVIKKIQNSYREVLTARQVENHLKLLAKEVPDWLGFHEVRNTMYLKLSRETDMKVIVEKLEAAANQKS